VLCAGGVLDGSSTSRRCFGWPYPATGFGLVFVTLFAVKLQIFPGDGLSHRWGFAVRWFEGLVLPVLTLGLAGTAPIAKQTRDRLARRARQGVRHRAAGSWAVRAGDRLQHVLRNAATPVLSVPAWSSSGCSAARCWPRRCSSCRDSAGWLSPATRTHDLP